MKYTTMPWQLTVCFQLVAILFMFLQKVNGCCNTTFEQTSFTYSFSDILETVAPSSRLQCARRSSFHEWSVAMEYQKGTSTCVILQSATRTHELTNTNQYRRNSCSEGWGRFVDSCYFITPSIHTWDDCKNICDGYGNSHLVSVSSAGESAFIKSFKGGVPIWTGGRTTVARNGAVGTWDNGEIWGYTHWATNQPNAYVADLCIHYYPRFNWGDHGCGTLYHCMCEKELL